MSDTSDLAATPLPSSSTLLKGTAVALVAAAVLLACVVLPAEYGIDPTGLGARLGLTALGTATDVAEEKRVEVAEALTDESAAEPAVSVFDALWKADAPFRTDEMSLTLQPNEGAEIKALMRIGDRMMFSWVAEGGAVNFDMHGEELNAGKDEFTSYWKGRGAANGSGAFQAPFAGTHGWYWRNRGSEPVTVRVKTSGYYEKLFQP
jgi:hypothetical protein